MNKILVLGGGSWGTTLGNLLAEKDHDVSLWARNSKIFKKVKNYWICLLYTSPSPRDYAASRMPSSA